VAAALTTVWASLWTMQAFEERDWYGIDHAQTAMGILVDTRLDDEQANVVAFTGNPSAVDDRYLVEAQIGAYDVVSAEAGVYPETSLVTVKDGETLSEIADRHGMSVNELVRLNDLSNADHVETGSTLRVKTSAVASSGAADGPSSYRKGASEHVVQPGQNLSSIAEGYGVPMSRLVAINGLQDANHVEVGMRLRLKGNPPTSAAPSTEAPPSRSVAPATAMANPVVASPVVATPVVTTPVVTTPVVTRPVVATPVVAKPVVTAPAPRASVARASQAPISSVLPAEASNRTDWRPYGPLQVDWANWQPMGGSLVAPTISNKGETLYLAINCSARKMNATSSNGDWKTWEDPRANFEVKLVNDRCRQSRL
jgi:LysM repeat protein